MNRRWSAGEKNSLTDQCVSYFRETPVLGRMLELFREKVASYGSFSGKVVLRNLKREDIEALEGFFMKSFHGQKSLTVSAEKFRWALGNSRFESVSPEELLKGYFGQEITGRKEQKMKEEERLFEIFSSAEKEWENTLSGEWIGTMREERPSYLVHRRRDGSLDFKSLKENLHFGARVLSRLPAQRGETRYLSVFAAEMTGNPHFFDEGTPEGRFLYQLVQWYLEKKGTLPVNSDLFPALTRQRIYLAGGILRDDISNYAIVSGVRGFKKDGSAHEGLEGFCREGEAVMIPLSVLARWERAEALGNRLYVVENPSVFAMIQEKTRGKWGCMCMNGQPRLASILLLELLGKMGTEVYYAGDFDPEGLLIAQKLRQYFAGPFFYWHLTPEDYEKSLSREEIAPRRMKILERVADPLLADTVKAMREKGRAGYQENIWDAYNPEEPQK